MSDQPIGHLNTEAQSALISDSLHQGLELDILRDVERAARVISGSMKDRSFSALQDALDELDRFRKDYP